MLLEAVTQAKTVSRYEFVKVSEISKISFP
jgi:hypothetical protein